MYEDENNLYHYSYRKGNEYDPNVPIDTKNYADEPSDQNRGSGKKKDCCDYGSSACFCISFFLVFQNLTDPSDGFRCIVRTLPGTVAGTVFAYDTLFAYRFAAGCATGDRRGIGMIQTDAFRDFSHSRNSSVWLEFQVFPVTINVLSAFCNSRRHQISGSSSRRSARRRLYSSFRRLMEAEA